MKQNQYMAPVMSITIADSEKMIALSGVNREGTNVGFSDDYDDLNDAAVKFNNYNDWNEYGSM